MHKYKSLFNPDFTEEDFTLLYPVNPVCPV